MRGRKEVRVAEAIKTGDLQVVNAYLKAGGDPNAAPDLPAGVPPIVFAALRGHAHIVKLLLERGATVDAMDPRSGLTALHVASATGQASLAQICIRHKADIESMTRPSVDKREKGGRVGCAAGYTPLQLAASNKNCDVVRHLIAAGARPDVAKASTGETALHRAASSGSVEVINRLLNAGAPLEATNVRGETPLHVAVKNDRRLEVVRFLLSCGADIFAVDIGGCTPLHLAAERGCAKIVEELAESGADPSTPNNKGCAALVAASGTTHVPVVKALMDLGLRAIGGKRVWSDALCSSARKGTIGAMSQLLTATITKITGKPTRGPFGGRGTSWGEDLPMRCTLPGERFIKRTGTSPLHTAAATGNLACVRMLVEAGADETALDADGCRPSEIVGKRRERRLEGHTVERAMLVRYEMATDERTRLVLRRAYLYRSPAWLWPYDNDVEMSSSGAKAKKKPLGAFRVFRLSEDMPTSCRSRIFFTIVRYGQKSKASTDETHTRPRVHEKKQCNSTMRKSANQDSAKESG